MGTYIYKYWKVQPGAYQRVWYMKLLLKINGLIYENPIWYMIMIVDWYMWKQIDIQTQKVGLMSGLIYIKSDLHGWCMHWYMNDWYEGWYMLDG